MSTATNNPTTAQFPTHGKTMFWRFVWKEFRMVRSLWAAVAIMGLLVQFAEKILLPGESDFVLMLLCTGLAAAVLYAAGAAATIFSVEHEEETYELLTRLPTIWWPPFAGKLAVTLLSALLLATALSISALLFRGPYFISGRDAQLALGMFGFAIIEAVAWGTLFSLLIKRPLLAAITTLIVGILTVHVAVNFGSHRLAASIDQAAYLEAIPIRLAIVVAVVACSVFVARGWLTAGAGSAGLARLGIYDRLPTFLTSIFGRIRQIAPVASGHSRPRMLSRLLWQTWRESWKLLLVPLGVAALIFAGIAAVFGLAHVFNDFSGFLIPTSLLFAPALYGAMAFYPDQRRSNYRFLAEHAARPRYIWFARHIVWLGALAAAWLLLIVGIAAIIGHFAKVDSRELFDEFTGWGAAAPYTMYYLTVGAEIITRVVIAATFGALVAYGVGQFLSMAIRSEILAAFLALLLSFVVGAWVYVCYFWELSATIFLLPIFIGVMLATWLRAPNWISGRNSLRAWLAPALALIAPLLLIGMLLPGARLAQLRYSRPISLDQSTAEETHRRDFVQRLAEFRAGDTTEATKTADRYERVSAKLAADASEDLSKRWRKPEYMDPNSGNIDETKLPPDERQAFKEAQKRQAEMVEQAYAAAIKEVIEISKRPACRFHFDPSSIVPVPEYSIGEKKIGITANRTYQDMSQLIAEVAGLTIFKFDQPAPRFLAALRMGRHLRSGQPSLVVMQQLKDEQTILQRIINWSIASGRTKEELRELLDTLTPELQSPESPAESMLADHDLILDVITGKQIPYILTTTPVEPRVHLAYLANQLGWEQKRATLALDRITRTNLRYIDSLASVLGNSVPQQIGVGVVRQWLRPKYAALPDRWEIQDPAAITSYLVSLEYKARVPISSLNRTYCDNVTHRHATLLQIALALYHLEHKLYPQYLADLVPDYLEQLPLDPYARQPFQYSPAGLNRPLKYVTFVGDYTNYSMIDRHRPFFWSVGAGNVRMILLTIQVESKQPLATDEEAKPGNLELVYQFVNEDQSWWDDYTLVFPMPD
jgi:hypothetical protein